MFSAISCYKILAGQVQKAETDKLISW